MWYPPDETYDGNKERVETAMNNPGAKSKRRGSRKRSVRPASRENHDLLILELASLDFLENLTDFLDSAALKNVDMGESRVRKDGCFNIMLNFSSSCDALQLINTRQFC